MVNSSLCICKIINQFSPQEIIMFGCNLDKKSGGITSLDTKNGWKRLPPT